MIPRKIHQLWLTHNPCTSEKGYPLKYQHHVNSIVEKNPGYTHRIWNDSDVRELFQLPELSSYLVFYLSLPYTILRCDFARFMILWAEGGIYLDLDFYGVNCFDLIIDHSPVVLTRYTGTGIGSLANGFMAGVKGHDFFLHILDFFKSRVNKISIQMNVSMAMGPYALYEYTKKWTGWEKWLIDSCLVFPVDNEGNALSGCDPSKALVYTTWKDGSFWAFDIMIDAGTRALNWSAYMIFLIALITVLIIAKPNKHMNSHSSNGIKISTGTAALIFILAILFVYFFIVRPKSNTDRQDRQDR